MKVRVRNTAAGPWGLILAGCVGVVPEATGAAMIAARQAEEVTGEVVVANPVETATAELEMETTAAPAPRRRRRHAEVS